MQSLNNNLMPDELNLINMISQRAKQLYNLKNGVTKIVRLTLIKCHGDCCQHPYD